MSNLELWNKYKEVPQNALKDFDNGNFKGTDINTMWRLKCLTDEYGICGIGWYYDIIRTWNECIPEELGGEILTFAEIKLYIKVNGEWSKGISGVGGNKMLSYIKSKEYFKPSDEAIKMAVTDAIGNACRNLGFGADVYWANDKTKYTDEDTTPKTPQKPHGIATKQSTTINKSTEPQNTPKTSENQPNEIFITFGRHRGKTLQQVYEEEPSYIDWLAENATTPAIKKAAVELLAQIEPIKEVDIEPVKEEEPMELTPVDDDNTLPF